MGTLRDSPNSSLSFVPKPKIDLSKVPRLVMAFYHNWYGSPTGPSRQWMHWNHPVWVTSNGEVVGMHDPEKFLSPDRRDIGATNYPLKGPYDSRDPEIIRWHIKMAREVGIDVFIIDWWGDTGGQEISDISMKAIMDLNEKEGLGMRFCILFDGLWTQQQPPPLDATVTRLEYAIKKFGNRPSYLRV